MSRRRRSRLHHWGEHATGAIRALHCWLAANAFERLSADEIHHSGSQKESRDAFADALVYAVSYISCRSIDDAESRYDDGDVGALESIAGFLQEATPIEEDQLAAAAERALAQERASLRPLAEFVRDYERWMEDMFGENWHGNRRVPV